jgi:hypothetical protein
MFFSGELRQGERFRGNLSSLLFAPPFLLLATAVGDCLIDRLIRLRGAFAGRSVFAVGLGLGALALVTFLAGMVVIPPPVVAWAVVIGTTLLFATRIGWLLLSLRSWIASFRLSADWLDWSLVAVVGLLVLLNVLTAFVPPTEYDVLEYHLGAPAHWARSQRIAFIRDNVYAAFPMNVEMIYLDAMVLRGGPLRGLTLGRLLNVGIGLLAACAAGACARSWFSPRAALPAVAIFYTWPWVGRITQLGYIETGLMFYVALSLHAAREYAKASEGGESSQSSSRASTQPQRAVAPGQAAAPAPAPGRLGWLVLLAICCGLAFGCKYPAALFVCLPAGVFVLIAGAKSRVRHALILTLVAMVVTFPWMIRNSVCTGNPVYPLLGSVLGGTGWTPRKVARWEAAHRPESYSLASMWRALKTATVQRYPRPIDAHPMSWLLIAFLPFAFVGREVRRRSWMLIGFVLFAVVGWLLLTHRIPRFLVPWLVPLVLLNAAGAAALLATRWRAVAGLVLLLLCLVEARAVFLNQAPGGELDDVRSVMAGKIELLIGRHELHSAVTALTSGTTYDHEAIRHITQLPPGATTLFLGEARTLYCKADIKAPTVFDENPFDGAVRWARSPAELRLRLFDIGITHLFVSIPELDRLQRTYGFEHDGRAWNGYFTVFDPGHASSQAAIIAGFLRQHTRIIYPAAARGEHRQATDDALLYTIREGQGPPPPPRSRPFLPWVVLEIIPPVAGEPSAR